MLFVDDNGRGASYPKTNLRAVCEHLDVNTCVVIRKSAKVASVWGMANCIGGLKHAFQF